MKNNRRTRRTRQEWEEIVRRYEASRESRAAFCLAEGLAVPTLDAYRRRVRMRGNLVELHLEAREDGRGPRITLSNGWRLEFGWDEVRRAAGEAEALRELLAKLEGQGACSA
jgi:hypothetical protein